ncbi:hypothetical protein [Streptomyces canus]|uniref:hypothetical protein n=1 Tax=Streptomyces canus TaxID=58343 RepID=UPI000374BCD9|nr:hypothetical protein [Streptomyces canus]
MKWLLLGALLALLLTIPGALPLAVAAVAAVATHPLFVAFVLGAVARPHLTRRWAR